MPFRRAKALVASLLVLGAAPKEATPDVREGDIVFQTSLSAQSQAIQLATHSRLSHVGVVTRKDGRLFVYEAIGPVTFTPLADWIARGEGKRVLVKRLRSAEQTLSAEALAKLTTAGARFRGKEYDFAFEWSDDRIYCSELVYKTYKEALGVELGKLQRLGDFDLADPRVQKKLRERYGDKVPLDEPVISPAQIADSPLLVTVGAR